MTYPTDSELHLHDESRRSCDHVPRHRLHAAAVDRNLLDRRLFVIGGWLRIFAEHVLRVHELKEGSTSRALVDDARHALGLLDGGVHGTAPTRLTVMLDHTGTLRVEDENGRELEAYKERWKRRAGSCCLDLMVVTGV